MSVYVAKRNRKKDGLGPVFYVYEHWRLDRDECFYVGKGYGNRAYVMGQRNRHHAGIVAKVRREGSAIEVRIVSSGLDESSAFVLEVERIAFWREAGVDLANYTNGGEGVSGRPLTDAQRKHLSDINMGKPSPMKGRKHTDEAKAKMSALGKIRGAPVLSAETIEKIAASHRGRKRSPETCAKIAEKATGRTSPAKGKPSPLRGRPRPEEVKAKISASKIGVKKGPMTEDQKSKIALFFSGIPKSEEQRRKMSETNKARWVIRKLKMAAENGN